MYQVRAVANWFIQKGILEGNPIEQMKLMKLVYVAQGLSLAINPQEPICDAVVEAWKYGPVIRDLYHEIKVNGNRPISKLLPQDEMLIGLDDDVTEYEDPTVPSTDTKMIKILQAVWRSFGKYTGIQLSNWTHEEESPWDKFWNKKGGKNVRSTVIDDSELAGYFSKFLKPDDVEKTD